MKGTEKIIAHIQADAKAQADAILAQAEQQCASIREDYEKKASAAYGDKITRRRKGMPDKVDSIERIAQMEAKKAVLALKQEMVSASFDKARDMDRSACRRSSMPPSLQSLRPRQPLPETRKSSSTAGQGHCRPGGGKGGQRNAWRREGSRWQRTPATSRADSYCAAAISRSTVRWSCL